MGDYRGIKERMEQVGGVGLLAVGILLVLAGQVRAAPQLVDTVHIVSDRLEAHQQERRVVFLGHVVATQGDLIIRGERMTIFYLARDETQADANALTQRMDRIVIEGNVRISQGDRLATGEHAVYYRSDNKVVLTGEPRVRRKRDVIQGTSITIFLDSEKSIVEGGPSGPVEATIFGPEPGGSVERGTVGGAETSGTSRNGGR